MNLCYRIHLGNDYTLNTPTATENMQQFSKAVEG
jgi:hypothetical protein